MATTEKDLGKLISSHSTSAAALQRAAIVAVVSFLFFLAMLIVFYLRQHIGYFALSTAFLVVYIFTLVGWVLQKRNTVRLYANGLRYKKFAAAWNEIVSVKADASGLELTKNRREKVLIPASIQDFGSILAAVKRGVE